MASANFDLGQNTIFDNAVDDNDGVDANVDLDVLEELFKDDFDDENQTNNGFGLVEINASTSNDEALRQIEQASRIIKCAPPQTILYLNKIQNY